MPKVSPKALLTALAIMVIPAILGLLQIWQILTDADGPQFSIEMEHSAFEFPPHLRAAIEGRTRVAEETEVDWGASMRDVEWNGFTVEEFESLKGYIAFSARNAGDRPAEELAVQFQGEGIAAVRRSDGTRSLHKFKDRLELGRLPVADSLTVQLWTESRFSGAVPLLPGLGTPKHPLLSHSTGSVYVGWSPHRYWPLLAFLVLFLMYGWYSNARYRRRQEESQQAFEQWMRSRELPAGPKE